MVEAEIRHVGAEPGHLFSPNNVEPTPPPQGQYYLCWKYGKLSLSFVSICPPLSVATPVLLSLIQPPCASNLTPPQHRQQGSSTTCCWAVELVPPQGPTLGSSSISLYMQTAHCYATSPPGWVLTSPCVNWYTKQSTRLRSSPNPTHTRASRLLAQPLSFSPSRRINKDCYGVFQNQIVEDSKRWNLIHINQHKKSHVE